MKQTSTNVELSFTGEVYHIFLYMCKEKFITFDFASAYRGSVFMHCSILTDYDSEI